MTQAIFICVAEQELLHTLAVLTGSCVDADSLTDVDEERCHDDGSGLEGNLLLSVC